MRSLQRSHQVKWIGVLALGTFAFVGCGGGDPAPEAAAENAVSSADVGHDAHGGGAHATPHGGHSASPHDGHGAAAGHGQPATAAHDAHSGMHSAPAGGHAVASHGQDFSSNVHGSPGATHGSPSGAHGSPGAAHGSPGGVHGSPSGMHGSPSAGHAGPGVAHLPPPGQGSPAFAAHGAHGSPTGGLGTAPGTAGEQKPTTEGWLTGLAAGVLAGGEATPTQPGSTGPVGGHGAASGYAGEMPGVGYEGIPGVDGAAANQPAQEFDAGTAEYAAQQLVLKMQSGDTTGYNKLISEKTKEPTLSALRDGKVDAAMVESNKELVEGASLVTIRESGASKLFVVKTASGKVVTITTREDGGAHKVAGFKVDTPRGVRGR